MRTDITTSLPGLVEASSFRLYLQAELARRCTTNAQYSLRSFALHLGINHSSLSQLLRGKRALTARTIEKLGARLGLTPAEIAVFAVGERQLDAGTAGEIRRLTSDTAALLADPAHRALLELTWVEQFVADSRWLARVLNLSVDEINVALQRLLRLGLLAMPERGRWLDCSGTVTRSDDEFARFIVGNLASRVRELSLRATVAESSEERAEERAEEASGDTDLSITSLTLKPAQLPLVQEFIARLQQTAADATEEAETYLLEIHLHSIKHD